MPLTISEINMLREAVDRRNRRILELYCVDELMRLPLERRKMLDQILDQMKAATDREKTLIDNKKSEINKKKTEADNEKTKNI